MPSSMIPSLLAQPDSVLSVKEVVREFIQSDYTLSHPFVASSPIHTELIRRPLRRQLGTFIESIMEEITVGLDELWGRDQEEWKEVIVYEDLRNVIARATNRVLVGPTICRYAPDR